MFLKPYYIKHFFANTWLILVLWVTLGCMHTFAQTHLGLPFMKYFGAKEYGAGIQNRTIAQNSAGFLYVANNFGLLEYDGLNWRNYALPKETKVRDIAISTNGSIYVASQGDFGYFYPSEGNELTYHSLADQLPADLRDFEETWKVFVKGNTAIFCTFSYLYEFENNLLNDVIALEDKTNDFFFVDNQLFLHSLQSGLTWMRQGEIKPFQDGQVFIDQVITGILPLANNHLLISTFQNGLFIYNGESHSPWKIPLSEELTTNLINTIYRLKDGNIAIGTQNDGLYIITPSGDMLYHIGRNEGLSNRTILGMRQDNIGNLWISHNNGISLMELNLPFSIVDEQSGLPGTGYDGLIHGEYIYLGTNNGLFTKELSSTGEYQLVEGTEGQVYDLQIIDDELFMGHHQGTFIIKDMTASQINDELGVWTFFKPIGHANLLIAGTYRGLLLFSKADGAWQFETHIHGLDESSRVIEQADDGTVWMTHGYKGAFKIDFNESFDSLTYQFYDSQAGFPSNILINVWRVNDRLVFSSEGGVYRYEEGTDSFVEDPFFSEHFGDDASISYLEEDLNGNIFYLRGDEAGVLEKNSNQTYTNKSTIFNRLKGYINDDLQKLRVLDVNRVLYAAKNGFLIYDKASSHYYSHPFSTLIRKVSLINDGDSTIFNGVTVHTDRVTNTVEEEFSLPFKQNSILVEFSAPYYTIDNEMVFQYKLNGSDEDWSEWTEKTDKEYTNLKEGSYTFYVRAKNTYNQLSDVATISFNISPPWYRSILAYLFYITAGMLSLALIYSYLDRRHKLEKRAITLSKEKEINQKETALRSSEEEVQKLRNEKLKAAIDSKNKELASSTMHLLNKNSFINSVKHNISTVIKRSKNQEVKKELSRIMQNIDKNIAADDEWQHFSKHFDQVHGDFTRRIKEDYPNLTPQEMKLSAYLRMNLSTKEIAHLLNISVRGVEIARYRLRKKLELERETNLQEFILGY